MCVCVCVCVKKSIGWVIGLLIKRFCRMFANIGRTSITTIRIYVEICLNCAKKPIGWVL